MGTSYLNRSFTVQLEDRETCAASARSRVSGGYAQIDTGAKKTWGQSLVNRGEFENAIGPRRGSSMVG